MDPSEMILNGNMSAARDTWQPPHNSVDASPMDTTRTTSPYRSPNIIIASRSCTTTHSHAKSNDR